MSGTKYSSFHKASVVVGATGMLAQATLWLASRSPKTLVVARQASFFVAGNSGMLACNANWNQDNFTTKLAEALDGLGPVGQVLLWLHDNERHLPQLLPLLESDRTVLVLGSMDGQPQIPPSGADLITVRLGSVHTVDGRRWLTHEEISKGAIDAFVTGESRVVGGLGSF